MPMLNGAVLGGDPPPRHSAPPTWEGKVAQVYPAETVTPKNLFEELAEQAGCDRVGIGPI
jgi:hypothetical protein